MFSECPPFEAQKGGGSTHLRQEQRVFWIQLLPREVPALCASPPEARGAQAKADLWPPPPPTSTTATAAALLAPAQRQCPRQLLRGTPFLAGSCLPESRTPQGPPRTYSSTPCCAHSHAATARPDILASGRLTTPGPLLLGTRILPRSWLQGLRKLALRSPTPSSPGTCSPPHHRPGSQAAPSQHGGPHRCGLPAQVPPPSQAAPTHTSCCKRYRPLWPHRPATLRGLPRGLTALRTALTPRTSPTTATPLLSSLFLPFLSCHLHGKTLTQLPACGPQLSP